MNITPSFLTNLIPFFNMESTKRLSKSLPKSIEELPLKGMPPGVTLSEPIIDMNELDRLSGPPCDIDVDFVPKSDYERAHKRMMEKYLGLDDVR